MFLNHQKFCFFQFSFNMFTFKAKRISNDIFTEIETSFTIYIFIL